MKVTGPSGNSKFGWTRRVSPTFNTAIGILTGACNDIVSTWLSRGREGKMLKSFVWIYSECGHYETYFNHIVFAFFGSMSKQNLSDVQTIWGVFVFVRFHVPGDRCIFFIKWYSFISREKMNTFELNWNNTSFGFICSHFIMKPMTVMGSIKFEPCESNDIWGYNFLVRNKIDDYFVSWIALYEMEWIETHRRSILLVYMRSTLFKKKLFCLNHKMLKRNVHTDALNRLKKKRIVSSLTFALYFLLATW